MFNVVVGVVEHALQSTGQAMVMLTGPTPGTSWMVPHMAVVAALHCNGCVHSGTVGDVVGVVVGADVGGQALQSAGQAMVMLTTPTTGIVWMVPHIAVVTKLHSDD